MLSATSATHFGLYDIYFGRFKFISADINLLYNDSRINIGDDNIIWRPDKSKCFTLSNYYIALSGTFPRSFPWKIIWKSRVPPHVALFVWTVDLGKILTIDNLQ